MWLEDTIGSAMPFALWIITITSFMETIDGNVSLGMRHLNGVYTQAFNRRHHRVGHVFQGRFTSLLVEQESYLLELCRYVVLNPVRAGIVTHPGAYRWSSYQATGGLVKPAPFVRVHWILSQCGKKPREAQKQYRRFVRAGMKEPCPWDEVKAQCILGSKEFIEKVKPALKDKSKVREIPKEQRLAFRPSLEELLPPEKGAKKQERNEAIHKAHVAYGYTLSEIAQHLRLHYATIGRIIKGAMLQCKT
jgi:putative transposase